MLFLYLTVIDSDDGKRTFEYYYVTYRKQMFYVAKSVLSNDNDAEDAVHNAFLGIAKHVDVLLDSDEEKAKCYCIKAAKNAALNIVRLNKQTNDMLSIDDMYNVPDEKSFEEMLDSAGYEDVLSVIRNMDDVYRDVLYMRYVMDMPVKKIATVLDRKESTVKQQLVRGKKILVSALSEEVMTANGK